MTVAEMIILNKEQFLQRYCPRFTPGSTIPDSIPYAKKLRLYAEQLRSGTAHSAPLKKHSHITNYKVLRYTHGSYKYSYQGDRNRTLHAVVPGLLFETKRGLFFFIFFKDKVIRMPSSMKRSVPEQRWITP